MKNPKIFVLSPNENWICDRFVSEWTSFYKNTVATPEEADIIWCIADWCWNQISTSILKEKKVVMSVHHIVPDKFVDFERKQFEIRDQFVDFYHVPCKKTHDQIRHLTEKEIFVQPFWVNGNMWSAFLGIKSSMKEDRGIDPDCFLVGSFQRDTEGKDLVSPKLEKGPDIFCDAVEILHREKAKEGIEVKVLLAGWRRQYVMKRLSDAGIKFYYAELPNSDILNELYACLDLYIVSARYEGGPQSIMECASAFVPIISTDIGVASEILNAESIFKHDLSDFLAAKPDRSFAWDKVQKYLMPEGFERFVDFFEDVV